MGRNKLFKKKLCRLQGCDNEVIAHKLCWKHYARARRNGDPLKLRVKPSNCKLCPKERYRFNGGESNMCKNHINIYRKERYHRLKKFVSSEPISIMATGSMTDSVKNSKTFADDSVSPQTPFAENQKNGGS